MGRVLWRHPTISQQNKAMRTTRTYIPSLGMEAPFHLLPSPSREMPPLKKGLIPT